MRAITNGVVKLVVSYLTVVVAFLLLPVFLVVNEVSEFDGLVNYLFDNAA